jgi:hypothetical protein
MNIYLSIVLGEETNIYTECCLYTCYLLQSGMADVFDLLYEQLRIASPTENNTLTLEQFQNFFANCYEYICPVLAESTDKCLVLKVILRMIGILSINEQNFDRWNACSIPFAHEIMIHLRENFANLCRVVNDIEWILFQRGLAILVSIELLQYRSNDFNENKVIFLQQIPDPTRRKLAAYKTLSRLHKINLPIFNDVSWTDLFTMIDPTKIDINHLNLTNSIETFVTCISKISKVLIDSTTFEKDMDTYLENRILTNCIEGKTIHASIRNRCRISL